MRQNSYYKVIAKCDRQLLQSASGITKCDRYYKVRRNNGHRFLFGTPLKTPVKPQKQLLRTVL